MAKYYVSSGSLRVVISGPHISSPKHAAIEACLSYYNENTQAESSIKVSEIGFEKHSTDIYFDTEHILKQAGFQFE